MIPHSKPAIGTQEIRAVNKVLKSGQISQGAITKSFEKEFSHYIVRRYGIATNSGTSALHLALIALRIRQGDEVIIPSYVCSAVLNAVRYIGATVKVVDVNPADFNISTQGLKAKIRSKTKAMIVPHMFGMAADMDELLSLGIPIVEDCAHALGSTYKGRKVGSFGLISIFSFYATKVITTAEGGMVLTNDQAIADKIYDLREYDHKHTYQIRYNYKMSDLTAAIGLEQLRRLPSFIKRRRKIAKMYSEAISGLNLELPEEKNDRTHIYYRYVIRVKGNISYYLKKLCQRGIECKRPVYKPLHQYLKLKNSSFAGTTKAFNSAISIPIYPSLEKNKVAFIIRKIKQVFVRK